MYIYYIEYEIRSIALFSFLVDFFSLDVASKICVLFSVGDVLREVPQEHVNKGIRHQMLKLISLHGLPSISALDLL